MKQQTVPLKWRRAAITWTDVNALFPSRASLSSEVSGGMSGGLEERSAEGSVVTEDPFPGERWQADAKK